jgi:hypothetical protein
VSAPRWGFTETLFVGLLVTAPQALVEHRLDQVEANLQGIVYQQAASDPAVVIEAAQRCVDSPVLELNQRTGPVVENPSPGQHSLEQLEEERRALEITREEIEPHEPPEAPEAPELPEGERPPTTLVVDPPTPPDPRLAALDEKHAKALSDYDEMIGKRQEQLAERHQGSSELSSHLAGFQSAAAQGREQILNEQAAERQQVQREVAAGRQQAVDIQPPPPPAPPPPPPPQPDRSL